jgi:glucose-6-phosphate 1-epimerase
MIVEAFERTVLPDGARIEKGSGHLERLAITADEGEAHVYLHGAHVTHFKPRDARPVLFVSRRSHFEGGPPGKPIRGGVPLCFPWFGPKAGAPDAPTHGFARILPWRLGTVTRNDGGALRTTLHLESNDFTRRLFPHDFAATFVVAVDARLTMDLIVRNTGPEAMPIEAALHSYFAVGDVRRVSIGGLEGLPYVDKTTAGARRGGEKAPIAIARETDRVYTGARGAVSIADPVWGRRIVVGKSGSATTVVWNPWIDKAKALADFGDDEWIEMVCVETANAMDDAVTIAPGATHAMSATIAVEPIDV